MILEPANLKELQRQLVDASANHAKVSSVKLHALNHIIEYTPQDMVVTTQTGITLDALQLELRKHGQWLPIDPPENDATIAEIISGNLSGPRRLGFGTIRDHLLGLTVLLANGTRVSGGGKVVKNVAGFDLPKLFVGARGTLGVPVEASFKLLPLPELERQTGGTFDSFSKVRIVIDRLAEARLWPVSFDLYQLEYRSPLRLLAGFAGAREDVETQIENARALGLQEEGTLAEQLSFWTAGEQSEKHSVLPSELLNTIEPMKPITFLARVGNGILFSRGGAALSRSLEAPELMSRLKTAYDPNGVLPQFSL